jgi:hypothetical protein
MLLLVAFFLGAAAGAQTKKPSGPVKVPGERPVHRHQRLHDRRPQERAAARTRIWPSHPDYNALALQRFFALMKSLEPTYKQDDNVAYTWSTKGRVTKCSIYLESADAGARVGTGAVVGCEANGVSGVPATSVADPKRGVSASQDPAHLTDVLDMFKKQSERAKNTLAK